MTDKKTDYWRKRVNLLESALNAYIDAIACDMSPHVIERVKQVDSEWDRLRDELGEPPKEGE